MALDDVVLERPGPAAHRTAGDDAACPVCGGTDARLLFEKDDVPALIGVLWPDALSARACPTGDVSLAFCPGCGFLWNRRFDPARIDYAGPYDNSLHHSGVFQDYTEALVDRLVSRYSLRGKDVVDIGCGGGAFLSMLCAAGGNRGYGFDPSYAGPETAEAGTGTIRFERAAWAPDDPAAPQADLVASRFVLEHIPDPVAYLTALRRGIRQPSRTVVYFEVPNVDLILRRRSIWDVIYEHPNYFGVESLSAAFKRAGFEILEVREAYDRQFVAIDARVAPAYLRPELDPDHDRTWGDVEALAGHAIGFPVAVKTRIAHWRARLTAWRGTGKRVALWGAGAKTVAFLDLVGCPATIDSVVDINPNKQGRHLPGSGHRVVAPEALATSRPDVVVIMNPVYRAEIADALADLGLAPELVEA